MDDDGADHDGADFVSIQAAIDAADDGDVIVVHPGLYVADPGASEVVDTLGKKVNIQSSGGHENTIIDGQGSARGLVCTSGETSETIIGGFTVRNGRSQTLDFNGNGESDHWENSGGGALIYGSSPAINGCVFMDCSSECHGGGLYSLRSSPSIQSCVFEGNSSQHSGGGLFLDLFNGSVDDCVISGNTAGLSGGGVVFNGGDSVFNGSQVSGNTAQGSCGGLFSRYSTMMIGDCEFEQNHSDEIGGGIGIFSGDVEFVNCLIRENTSGGDGGGLASWFHSNVVLDACEVLSNHAADDGGGLAMKKSRLFFQNGSELRFNSCGEHAGGLMLMESWAKVSDSIVMENTSVDEGAGVHCDFDSHLLLTNSSVCENAPTQIHGAWTEGEGGCVSPACSGAAGQDCGDSIGDGVLKVPGEYASIQDAIDAAGREDTIEVSAGTWTGTGDSVIDLSGKNIAIVAIDGPEDTILDGEGERRVVLSSGGSSLHPSVVGFTITGGYAEMGAGILCYQSNPTFEDCWIVDNHASADGGGVLARHASPTFSSCRMAENSAGWDGGGLACYDGMPLVIDSDIYSNIALDDGGGVYCFGNAHPNIEYSRIYDNIAGVDGGGLFGGYLSEPRLYSVLFCGNEDLNIAGGFADVYGNLYYTDCGDCNGNGVPDSQDLLDGILTDMDADGLPDQCESDCDQDGVPDPIEIAEGMDSDIDEDGVPDSCQCRADLNENGSVDIDDLVQLLGVFGYANTSSDLNDDGQVDLMDLLILLDRWGQCE
ncbi:MAG: hypothetical protein CMJ40_06890 [Phycisphaerae bacterium]|nr:hypothetical protein [Phycisphaerae bacterium]